MVHGLFRRRPICTLGLRWLHPFTGNTAAFGAGRTALAPMVAHGPHGPHFFPVVQAGLLVKAAAQLAAYSGDVGCVFWSWQETGLTGSG